LTKTLKFGQQQRSIHTKSRISIPKTFQRNFSSSTVKRSAQLESLEAASLLKAYNIPIASSPSVKVDDDDASIILGITVARSARSPCILVSPTSEYEDSTQIPFDYSTGPQAVQISEAIMNLGLRTAPSQIREQVDDIIHALWKLYLDKQAISIYLSMSTEHSDNEVTVSSASISLDPASKTNSINPQPDAGKEGIIYVNMPDPSANVGTLVNGAGLAMNTVDALGFRGLSSTNFLDTGGKATSQTVSTAMEMVLSDSRVKVVFVNIFGGLTKCDMIAEGIIQAFEKQKANGGIKVPVVVRLRGTREEEGQRVMKDSGLKGVYAFDDFEEAVDKIKDLLSVQT
jgi:succinyl-CoA synthetase alpha subunit